MAASEVRYTAKIAFIMDLTSSMKRSVDAVHKLRKKVIDDSIKQFPAIDLYFAFVGYRDYCDAEDERIVTIPFTPACDVEEVFDVLNTDKFKAKGGGDVPEDVLGGMEACLQLLDWSEARVKIGFHVGDAPHHGLKFHTEDILDDHLDMEDRPRGSRAILRDFAFNRIDYYFFEVHGFNGNITSKMVSVFKKEYNACQSRTKNFTSYEFAENFDVEVFFQRVMDGVSRSVGSYIYRNGNAAVNGAVKESVDETKEMEGRHTHSLFEDVKKPSGFSRKAAAPSAPAPSAVIADSTAVASLEKTSTPFTSTTSSPSLLTHGGENAASRTEAKDAYPAASPTIEKSPSTILAVEPPFAAEKKKSGFWSWLSLNNKK